MPKTKLKLQKIEDLDPFDDGTELYAKQLKAKKFAQLADKFRDLQNKTTDEKMGAMAEVCCIGICDEKGKALFETPDEVLEESFSFMEIAAEAVLAINGLAPDSLDTAVKNS